MQLPILFCRIIIICWPGARRAGQADPYVLLKGYRMLGRVFIITVFLHVLVRFLILNLIY